MQINSIEWQDDQLHIIDQTKLPEDFTRIQLKTLEDVEQAIRLLKVRGAPAIGIAAAYGAYLSIRELNENNINKFHKQCLEVTKRLNATRPTAVNLSWALNQIENIINNCEDQQSIKKEILRLAIEIHEDDRERCRQMGKYGATLIPSGSTVLTHCNTGILATGGIGTALSAVYTAWENHKNLQVYADETRPLLQGARLTAWELKQNGIPVTLIADNMAAWLMKQGKIDLIIVGADRIAVNGDAANKIGTYSLAVNAKHHGIPFYIAAPLSTFDFSTPTGEGIVIEERDADEIRFFGQKRTAPENVDVYNPAFDVTPQHLITALITENGIIENKDFNQIKELIKLGVSQ